MNINEKLPNHIPFLKRYTDAASKVFTGQLYPNLNRDQNIKDYKKATIEYCDSCMKTFGNEPHGLRDSVKDM